MKAKKKVQSRGRTKGAQAKPISNRFWLLARYFFLIFILVGCDVALKQWVNGNLPRLGHEMQWYPYGGIGLFEDFMGVEGSIVHTINHGAAWGLFPDYTQLLLLIRIAFVACLTTALLLLSGWQPYYPALFLLLAGALGNILDAFIYGHVVDMFKFVLWGYHYPVFNLADSYICIGAAILFLINTVQERNRASCKSN